MGRNLIAHFKGGENCKNFTVKIISDTTNRNFDEVYLAGESPFVVTYDTTQTPFDPIRLSRASITVVADEKFFDVFSAEAQGTQVILSKDAEPGSLQREETLWVGYLTSNLLNMPQNLCGPETFTLEAKDCLSTLENYYYQNIDTDKSIVNFRKILGQIAERCGLINDMYIDSSMLRSNGTYIEMADLTISEQNFYSSDTDEPWNLKQVLEEICRYLGYTATQYKDSLYLYDMQSHSEFTWQTDHDATMVMNGFRYRKSTNWNSYSQGSWSNLAQGITLRQGIVRGTGADISLETIYQKVQVKDSFYQIDHFIPDMFEDSLLENRYGDFWKCSQISRTGNFKYINKNGKSKKEEKDESEHVYYIRKFNHKDYTPIYRNKNTLAIVDVATKIMVTDADSTQRTTNYDTGEGEYVVKATFKNIHTSSHQIKAYAKLEYKWYDGYHYDVDSDEDQQMVSFTLRPGESSSITLTCHAQYDTGYTEEPEYSSWYIIDNVTSQQYGITNNSGVDLTGNYVGATITDLATFDKPMSTSKYNYETDSSISFTRYLMIHQYDKPDRMHPYATWLFLSELTALRDDQIESYFPAVMELNDGYRNPMLIDSKAYIAIDAAAIFERYNVEYINPDWTQENSNLGGLGLFTKTHGTCTAAPCLIFKLKIGDKYWSSQSGWTTTDSCFVVNLNTDKTDKDDVDFSAWWNEEHHALNNIDWTDYAGVSGYKIPLDETIDFSRDIKLWVMMPSKMQEVSTTAQYDGMNNMCWIPTLDFKFATKGSLNYDLSDVLYENVIDSGSTNTLSDISCKITTYPGMGAHSYSSVGLDGVLLTGMKKVGLDDVMNIPEENILKAYVNQYNEPTIRQTLTLQSYISPFSYVRDDTLGGKIFSVLGTTIDYAKDSQTMTLLEVKPWMSA